jgi:2-polyprenyl-3-methyl-5-hydroxy-6-metoxy-1,4-benzoquinol methylase
MEIYSDPIAEQERIKYEKVWTTIEAYNQSSPGLDLADKAIKIFKEYKVKSVIDAGCGTGKVLKKFYEAGFLTRGIDITFKAWDEEISGSLPIALLMNEVCLWDLPHWMKAFDAIYCIDVMEHIPEEKVEAVIDNLADRCNKIAIFQIAMFKDRFGDLIGERLHLTIKPKEWWAEKILRRFKNILEIRNIRGRFTFVCEVI